MSEVIIMRKLIRVVKMSMFIMVASKVIMMSRLIVMMTKVIMMSRLIIVMMSKVIMMSKGSIGNFLADEQPLPLGQEIIRFC